MRPALSKCLRWYVSRPSLGFISGSINKNEGPYVLVPMVAAFTIDNAAFTQFKYEMQYPTPQGPRPCEGALVAQVGVLFAPCFSSVVLRVRVRRYYRVLLPLWVGTFEFQWT